MKYLITGATKGFGKFVFENLGGFGLTRQNRKQLKNLEADTIIHCAYDRRNEVSLKDLPEYLDSNIFLTKELLYVPHRKFVFLSTVNVYKKPTMYSLTKLICEEMIKQTNHLILRCSGLLGKYSKNNLTKLINGEKLSLSGDSELNFVSYKDVLDFIKRDKSGTYEIASSENIRFSEIAEMLNKNPQFGDYNYQAEVRGNFKRSKDAILEFISNVKD